jgi:hypothetical protein
MSVGVACPNCRCKTSIVKDSRPQQSSTIRRRRKCGACGARYTTIEVVIADRWRIADLTEAAAAAAAMIAALRKLERCEFIREPAE